MSVSECNNALKLTAFLSICNNNKDNNNNNNNNNNFSTPWFAGGGVAGVRKSRILCLLS